MQVLIQRYERNGKYIQNYIKISNETINIIFDFDGVILNSHKVKTDAFEKFCKFGKSIERCQRLPPENDW